MSCAAVMFDIDGTLLPMHDPKALGLILNSAADLNASVWINTARSEAYCENPFQTQFVEKEKHRCMSDFEDSVTQSKLDNMHNTGVDPKRNECVILIDDLKSNVDRVTKSKFGFTAFEVDPKFGIDMDTANSVRKVLSKCCG